MTLSLLPLFPNSSICTDAKLVGVVESLAIDSSPRIYLKNANGVLIAMNPTAAAHLHIPQHEIENVPITSHELYDDATAENSDELDRQAIDTGVPVITDIERLVAVSPWIESQPEYVRALRMTTKTEAGETILITMHVDVTKEYLQLVNEQRQHLQARRESRRIRKQIQSIPAEVGERLRFSLDQNGYFLSADERLCAIYGIDPSDLASTNIQHVTRDDFKRFMSRQQKSGYSTSAKDFLFCTVDKHRADLWIRATSSTVVHNGVPVVHGDAIVQSQENIAYERFRRCTDGSRQAVFELDFISEAIWITPRFSEFTGYSTEDANSFSSFLRVVAVMDREPLRNQLRTARDNPSTTLLDMRFRIVTQHEKTIWVEARGTFTRNENGIARYFSGSLFEITDQQNLALHNGIVTQAIDQLENTMVFVKRRDGTFRYTNNCFATFFGLTAEEMDGSNDALLGFGPEQQGAFLEADKSVLDNRRAIEVDETLAGANDTRRFRTKKCCITIDGIDHVLGIATDITDIESEHTDLTTLLDSLPLAIHIKGPDGKYELVNELFYRKAGVKARGDIINRTCREVFPKYWEEIEQKDAEAESSAEPITYRSWLTQSGIRRLYEITKVSRKRGGSANGIIGISRDITDEAKRSDARLREKLHTQRLKAMETLIRSLRHDFVNQFLGVIRKDIQKVESLEGFQCSAPEWQEKLVFLETYIDQLQWWVPEQTSGKKRKREPMQIQKSPIKMLHIAEAVKKWCNRYLRTPDILLSIAPDVELEGDTALLQLLLLNVVHNAKKMTPDAKKENDILVSAKVCQCGSFENGVLVSVDDGGDGFPRALDLALLGKKLGIACDPPQRSVKGSGFGLFLCRQIAAAHNGGFMLPPERSRRGGALIQFFFPSTKSSQETDK